MAIARTRNSKPRVFALKLHDVLPVLWSALADLGNPE